MNSVDANKNQLFQNSLLVKSIAIGLGFDYCGIAKAGKLDEDARRLEQWLNKNRQGNMEYMSRNFEKRIDPTVLMPGAKSVITLLLNYYPEQKQSSLENKISKYAYGNDYHEVIKSKLHEFLYLLREKIGDIEGRGFVDSAPVLERAWAMKSGLGWVGKNGNLITKKSGSFFFIATLIVDVAFEYDISADFDHCGTCTKCIETCPTEAILPNKEVDGSKCISYFTIELKDALIPENMKGKFDNWMFGCDTCQDVCPWNRFSTPTTEKQFQPLAEIISFNSKDWEAITEEKFKIIFKDSPIKRSKYSGIKRNLQFLKTEKSAAPDSETK
jgi:epoxyqueuosine reductase